MKTYQIDNDVIKDFEEIKPVANELLGFTKNKRNKIRSICSMWSF